jgi:hypothetical protein
MFRRITFKAKTKTLTSCEFILNFKRAYEQTLSYIEKVATTKNSEDITTLSKELGIQLRELELERKGDHKKVPLHPFEVASLANLIKAVRKKLYPLRIFKFILS